MKNQTLSGYSGATTLAVALRNRVSLASLQILEAPAPEMLRDCGEREHYRAFRQMTAGYFAAFAGGNAEAIAATIDFYGGAGTYASWPPRMRAASVETTAVNVLDWASAYGFVLSAASLAAVQIPALVIPRCFHLGFHARRERKASSFAIDVATTTSSSAALFATPSQAASVAREVRYHS
jgi:hypothetical protein